MLSAAATADFAVARYNPDGSLDTSLRRRRQGDHGHDLDRRRQRVAVQADGKILAGGYSDASGSDADFALVRYNPDGSLDPLADGTGKVTTPRGPFGC